VPIAYVIQYNLAVKDTLAPFFEPGNMWDVRPYQALKFSVSATEGADSTMSSENTRALDVKEFLQVLFSAMPRDSEIGNIVGFASSFFGHLRERGEIESLVHLTNYIFKSLSLSSEPIPPLLAERAWRVGRELHFWANIHIHAARSVDPAYRQLPETLNVALKKSFSGEVPRDLVFVFLTSAYVSNLGYWLDLYQRHDAQASRLCILCIGDDFEEPMEDWLALRGAGGAHILKYTPPMKLGVCGNGNNLDFLWYIKIHVVKFLLERGSRVIYSDLDAYWIKDYFAVRAAVRDEVRPDMILSATYDMPRSVVAEQGFTCCAGFFSVDPTAAAKAILTSWCLMTEVMFDDQIALAELLTRHGAAWQPRRSDYIGASADIMTEEGFAARLVLLDPAVAHRVGLPDPATIGASTIWHPRWVMAPEQHKEAIRLIAEAPL
jgi:hypothetical protein